MKMMKLLGAASTAALIAGAANAQLALELSDATLTPGAGFITETGGTITVAEEVDFAALSNLAGTPSVATVGLEVLTQGQIPPGQNIFLTVELTNAQFASALDGDEVVDGDTGSVVQAGGAAGDSTVQYLVTSDTFDAAVNGGGRDGIALEFPIVMLGCGDVTAQVTQFETETAGTVIEGGTATLTSGSGATLAPDEIAECDDVFTAQVVPDDNATAINFATGFTSFVVGGPDIATTAELGQFTANVGTGFVDFGTTAAAPANVDGFAATVNFADDTGIASGTTSAIVGALFTNATTGVPSGDAISLAGTTPMSATTATADFDIVATGGTTPIAAQVVSVSGAVLTLDGTYLVDTDPFLVADVEDLVFNGSTFGPFDWVADTNGRVNSIFRITGLGSITQTVPALLILENSRNGNNGVFPFSISPTDVQGSEVRLTSASLEGFAGAFSTADVTMVFGQAGLDLDVDRLLSGPSTATVVPFGDAANSDTGSDTDDTSRATNEDDGGNF